MDYFEDNAIKFRNDLTLTQTSVSNFEFSCV